MAVVDFEVGGYGKNRGAGAATLMGSLRLSGQDTITTVENVEDAGGDITANKGEIFSAHCSAACRINFGGTAATSTTGFYFPANVLRQVEVPATGNVSCIALA